MAKTPLQDVAAITGIGQTEFSQGLNRSVMDMTAEAILKAIDDAGLKPEDIDGMSRYHMQDEWENVVHATVGLGEITYYADQPPRRRLLRRRDPLRRDGHRDRPL